MQIPALFSDGMVIAKKAKIWGFSNSAVTIKFLDNNIVAEPDKNGRFEVVVTTPNFGGPFTMTIGDRVINDVYVGKVWICGGQSNMEGPMVRTKVMWQNDIVEDCRIRMFQVEKGLKFDAPATDVKGSWRTAAGDMDSLFAAPYFFARQLLTDSDTPIGLICPPAGGTPIQGWLPEDIVQEFPDYYNELLPLKEDGYIEKATEEANKNVQEWYTKLHQIDKGVIENWQDPSYDDSGWEAEMLLNPRGLPQHGSVWFRKAVNLPAIKGKVTLNLGRAENNVKVYVNGEQVVSIEYMYPPCTCTVPEGLLKEGENLIAVRLIGDGNNPRFVPGKNYSLEFDNKRVDLSGRWKRRVGAEMPKGAAGVWFYGYACGVYNYMLAPVLGYSADGIIWYQGESNTGRPDIYKAMFTRFVEHVRTYYGNDFPVIFNQLANYVDPGGNQEGWVHLREQQRQCLSIPNTAMSVSIDCGEWNDLHPVDKKTVGERLALHARRLAYKEDIVSDGPIVKQAEISDKTKQSDAVVQHKIIIHFNNAEGLWAGGYPILDIVDKSGKTHHVYAKVKGETLEAETCCASPKKVRFGWSDCPATALYNAQNLPASPFEIDLS